MKRITIVATFAVALGVGAAVATASHATTAAPTMGEKNLVQTAIALRAVLLYHVVKGKVTAAQAMKLRSAKTLEGKALSIRVSGGKVIVGGATVITPNMTASNGVIHVINKVLIP